MNSLIGWGATYLEKERKLRLRIGIENLRRVRKIIGKVDYSEDLEKDVVKLRKIYKGIVSAQEIKTMTKTKLLELAKKEDINFSGTPYEHQIRGVMFLWFVPKAGLYYDAGLGKMYIGLNLFANLREHGLAKKMLVLCPADIIEDSWLPDIEKFTTLDAVDCHVGVGRQEKRELMRQAGDIFLQSYNGYMALSNYDYSKNPYDICFFDESSILKKPKSVISGAMRNTDVERVVLASGLPAPNKEAEYYSQMWIVGQVLGNTHGAFKDRYMMQPNAKDYKWLWVFKHGMKDVLLSEIEPYTIFAKKQDWIDCPDRVPVDLFFPLAEEQKKHYYNLENQYFTLLKSGEKVRAKTELTLRGKLAQVVNGFLFTEEGQPPKPLVKDIKKLPKFVYLKNKVDSILANPDNNIIIWGRFRNDIEVMGDLLKEYKPAVVYGGVTRSKKGKELTRWVNDPSCRIIISHPKSTKFGHTWLKAGYMIWFSATESYEDYYQGSQRNDRIGQSKDQIVDIRMIAQGTIDKDIYDIIERKETASEFVKKIKGVRR